MMRILVTGSTGFIGKNLMAELRNRGYVDILEFGRESSPHLLNKYCEEADFIYHLAGVNRPNNLSDFRDVNYGLTSRLLDTLKKHQNRCPIMYASSLQAQMDNPYGISKKASEDLLLEYSRQTGAEVFIYRLPNVFGKWCRPHYNSAIATFCHSISRGLPYTVNDPNVVMNMVYIDDVIVELINNLNGHAYKLGDYCEVEECYTLMLGEVVDLLLSFKKSREDKSVPYMADSFTKKLYSTYLSYLPDDQFSYELNMNSDHRGSFTEFIKTPERGQVSVNVSSPHVTKGNHWHHTKNEKFLVVSGVGVIRLRKIDSDKIIEYYVSGSKLEVIDIPVGYTHNIENLGEDNLVTIMWANECFDPNRPDTHYLEV